MRQESARNQRVSPKSWKEFTEEYLAVICVVRSEATCRATRQVLAEFGKAGVRTTSDVGPQAIARWIQAYPSRGGARIGSLLRTLAPALRYAHDQGYTEKYAFATVKPARWVRADYNATPRPRRSRTKEEIGRVLDRADLEAASLGWVEGRLQALVYLLAYTGLRKQEALRLTPDDINLDRRVIVVRPKAGWRPKTLASTAELPIAEALLPVLRRWLPRCGGRWVFAGAKQLGPWLGGLPGYTPLCQVRALGERAGVPGLTMLGFRKTIGTEGKAAGINQLEMKGVLRHSNIETQKFYDDETPETLRPAVEKIQYPRIRKVN